MKRDKVFANLYRDSIALMELSAKLVKLPRITRATAVMGTSANIALLAEAGLLESKIAPQPNNLLLVVEGDEDDAVQMAMREAELMLHGSPAVANQAAFSITPTSLEMALEDFPSANIALISTPGEYAASEAEKALRLGLSAMVFSSNVTREDELVLKRLAQNKELLLMGPDCGTAIVNGIPLGFANALRRGSIGLAASAGTGLQEVSCLIDRAGLGVSQALGCGSRDLSREISAITTLQSLALLAADVQTEVIVLIAKHPEPEAAQRVLDAAVKVDKPIVICFLGFEVPPVHVSNVRFAGDLEEAARMAVLLAGGQQVQSSGEEGSSIDLLRNQHAKRLGPTRKYIRGLFSGGTFCYEAQLLAGRELGRVWSNTPIRSSEKIPDVWKSFEHTMLDLGDEVFTRGRLHPMIDQRLRLERFAKEMSDLKTAVILFDVVLGFGAHPNPAAEIAEVINGVRAEDRPALVASICGTNRDPQGFEQQAVNLRRAGVELLSSNAAAVRFATGIVTARKLEMVQI